MAVNADFWQPGETIIQRFVGHGDGQLAAYPHIVIEDSPERTVLFQPEGAAIPHWDMNTGRWLDTLTAGMHALRFVYPHRPYYVTMWFEGTGVPSWWKPHLGGYQGRFRGWSIDMAAPHRRTAIGFDTTDDVLDYIIRPDGTAYFKDDEDLTGFTQAGVYTPAEAARIRQAAQELLPHIAARESPFDDEWTGWQPAPDLAIGSVSDDWLDLPGSELHLSTLNYELGLPGRHYDAWRTPESPPLWSWRRK